jgi:hypothetical protein
MSSQFSYELDERQIRILMQNTELDYNEVMWNKFEEMAVPESKSSIGNFVPSINLSISRSIIVPILFIILIGGLSGLLFSFVDFKKKEVIEKEVPLVANPENFKKPEVKPKKTTIVKRNQTVAAVIDSVAIKTPSVEVINLTTTIPSADSKKETVVKTIDTKPKEESAAKINEVKKETIVVPVKKKRKRNMQSEELQSINTPINLNEGATEPELDLK